MHNKAKFQPFFGLTSFLVGLFFYLILSLPAFAATADYQRCKLGTSCIIGEFLYDDNYVPIPTANCTLTSRDPGGQVYINSAAMTASSDGWYSYNVNTVNQTEGLYRSQMCCTESTNYMCLDKSFYIGAGFLSGSEVQNSVWNASTSDHTTAGSFGNNLQQPVLSASQIWGYTDRTLSGFGTLVSDIWSYSTRSMTGFGTLVSDLWSNDTRTLTSADLANGGELSTTESVEKTSYSIIDNETNETGNKNVKDALFFSKGAVNFLITVSNPSKLIAQKVPFVYYFPEEVKKDDIIKIDETLEADSDNNQVLGASTINTGIYVSGDVELEPSASKKLNFVVKDVWTIQKEEIDALRLQSDTLFGPLKKTSYYGQGATLKSDIDANLNRAMLSRKEISTPELKIKAYRNAVVEMNAAKSKINDLKTLVAQAGSAKSLFGFIGGVQVASVWGMILIFIAGFVFMMTYMKKLNKQESHPIDNLKNLSHTPLRIIKQNHLPLFVQHHWMKMLSIFTVLLYVALFAMIITTRGKTKIAVAKQSIAKIKSSLVTPTAMLKPTVSTKPVVLGLTNDKSKVFVVVPSGSSVNVRTLPSTESKIVYVFKSTAIVNKVGEVPDWVKIEIPENKMSTISANFGWINKELSQEVPK